LPSWMQEAGSQQGEDSHLEEDSHVDGSNSSNASISNYGGSSAPSTPASSIDPHNTSSDSSKQFLS
jgi:hypothetical protein